MPYPNILLMKNGDIIAGVSKKTWKEKANFNKQRQNKTTRQAGDGIMPCCNASFLLCLPCIAPSVLCTRFTTLCICMAWHGIWHCWLVHSFGFCAHWLSSLFALPVSRGRPLMPRSKWWLAIHERNRRGIWKCFLGTSSRASRTPSV